MSGDKEPSHQVPRAFVDQELGKAAISVAMPCFAKR